MSDTGFDLLSRPWIRVREGSVVTELSLRGVFAEAHRVTALAGELPTQDVALLRLMLAVLHRAVAGVPGHPTDVWRRLWQAHSLPMDRIGGYLDGVADRFDIFDDTAPFLQVAGLSAAKTSGLVKLIADVPDGQPFFTTRAGPELESLSPAEAARWVVHCQAFDPSGIKTGVHGDPRVKGGKGYPIGTGWTGRCGVIVFEGGTLKETLLLNLVLGITEADAEPDLPVWERRPLGPGVETRHPEPLGPADIMTWPSRRILLHRRGEVVTDVLLGNGDRIESANRHTVEPMTAWRRSDNQEKKLGGTVYMPKPHDPSRALWRGLAGILVQRQDGGAVREDPAPVLPPANVTWLATVVGNGLDPTYPVRLRAVGVSYGTQDASIEAIYDDALSLRVVVTSDPLLRATALDAAAVAESAIWQGVGRLAENLAAAAGRAVEGPRERAREDAYERVGAAYAAWLARLAPGVDPEQSLEEWQREVRSILIPLGRGLIDEAGRGAWVGRDVKGRHVDSAVAWAWFLSGLRKALPAAATRAGQNKEQT